jgi:hypothetical protein
MSFREESVSADPGPNGVPTTTPTSTEEDSETAERPPVIAGLEAQADNPGSVKPLEHPEELVGERPALGSNEEPG